MQNNSYKKMFKHIYQFVCSWLRYVILFQATSQLQQHLGTLVTYWGTRFYLLLHFTQETKAAYLNTGDPSNLINWLRSKLRNYKVLGSREMLPKTQCRISLPFLSGKKAIRTIMTRQPFPAEMFESHWITERPAH